MKIVSVKEMQELDRKTIHEFGLPALVLMERASLGVAEVIKNELPLIFSSKRKVIIATGTGNNGGDGLAIARLLFSAGKDVHIILIGDDSKRSEENRIQLDIIKKMGITNEVYSEECFHELVKESDLIIDAVFGVGLTREITGDYKKITEQINQTDLIKVSVDIPSGLDADTGETLGVSVEADYTVTFAFPKTGLLMDQALDKVGYLKVIDIGIPKIYEKDLQINYLTPEFVKQLIPPPRKKSSFKNKFGRALIIGGSDSMSGAVVLAIRGALKTGAGLVNGMVSENIQPIVASQVPTAMVNPIKIDSFESSRILFEENIGHADSVAFGPGAGKSKESLEILKYLINNFHKPLLIDADGINLLAENIELLEKRNTPIILTPHVGEFARLLKVSTKEIQKNRLASMKYFYEKYKAVIVLKGAKTIISDGETTYINSTGNPALARGGSGDILSGLICGLMAQGLTPLNAGVAGVYIHGLMADLAIKKMDESSIITEEFIDFISPAFLELRR